MAALLLGPVLRYVGETEATLWVETDAPCEASVLGASARTFCVDGHHYSLVTVTGLEPGTTYEYEVELEGQRAWPPRSAAFPPSLIRILEGTEALRIVFGSCRASRPHEPPFALDGSEDEQGQGIDALRTTALRMQGLPADEWPHLLLMLGDHIYADALSPAMRAVTESRSDATNAPRDELASFSEYALAYREAWGDPVVRWLLSTVPSAMVFDDHEIHAEWKISQAWLDRMRRKPWYDGRIASGLAAYWVYQHLGNLTPEELRRNELLARVREVDDAGPLLRDFMRTADRQPGHSRWSYCRDLGHTRLVVIDARAGRELRAGERRMVDDGEWEWISERATGDFEHLLLASSVPFHTDRGASPRGGVERGVERRGLGRCGGEARGANPPASRDGPLGVVSQPRAAARGLCDRASRKATLVDRGCSRGTSITAIWPRLASGPGPGRRVPSGRRSPPPTARNWRHARSS